LRLEETDVLHAPAYVMPLLAPLVARRPVVLTVHDTIALDRPDLTTYLNAMHFGLTMPLSLRLARTIIVPTSVVADRLIRISVPERKIRVIPWGIDDIFTNPESRNSDDEVLERLGVERPYVLHVGALEPKKNLEYLVKAFFAFSMNSSAPHKLVLAGPKGESAGRLWRLVESLGARGNVVFTGFVADEDLPVLYRHADLVVCPSLEEGFGFTPLEALASGAPVITSDIPAFREVLGRSVPMFDPADLPALRLKLTDLLANESARAEIIAAGRERAAGYTWKRCARETLAVYSSCMA
jgi:glycosyltransferase involved in cell wall biosynthesis